MTRPDDGTKARLIGVIVLCALIAAGATYWTVFAGGPILPEQTRGIRITLRDWELPRRTGTIVFRDEQGRSFRLVGDLNRFRLREWATAWKTQGAEPFDFTIPRESGGDPVDVFEVAQNGVRFVTLADINAFRADERKSGYLLVALFLALGGFGVYAYRTEFARTQRPAPPAAPGVPAGASGNRSGGGARIGQAARVRLAAAGCILAGIGAGYFAMFVPWSEALRHQNRIETSVSMIVLSTVLIVAPLPYLIAPRHAVASLGTTTQPTALGRKLAIGVAVLGFVVHELFKAGLRQLGYGG
jgi:hypothetical protein